MEHTDMKKFVDSLNLIRHAKHDIFSVYRTKVDQCKTMDELTKLRYEIRTVHDYNMIQPSNSDDPKYGEQARERYIHLLDYISIIESNLIYPLNKRINELEEKLKKAELLNKANEELMEKSKETDSTNTPKVIQFSESNETKQ